MNPAFGPVRRQLRLVLQYGWRRAFLVGAAVAWGGPLLSAMGASGLRSLYLVVLAATAAAVLHIEGDPTLGVRLPLRPRTRGLVTSLALLGPAVLGWLGGLVALSLVWEAVRIRGGRDAVTLPEMALAAAVFTVTLGFMGLVPAAPRRPVVSSRLASRGRIGARAEARSIPGPPFYARVFWQGCVDEARFLAPWAAALLVLLVCAAHLQSPIVVRICRSVPVIAMFITLLEGGTRGLGLPGGPLAALLCLPVPLTTVARLLFVHILLWRTLLLLGAFLCLWWVNDVSGHDDQGIEFVLALAFVPVPFSCAVAVRKRFGPSRFSAMSCVRAVLLFPGALALLAGLALSLRATSFEPTPLSLGLILGASALLAAMNLWEILAVPPLRRPRTRNELARYRSTVWSFGAVRPSAWS
jgi:hypothetical protein